MRVFRRALSILVLFGIGLTLVGMIAGFVRMQYAWVLYSEFVLLMLMTAGFLVHHHLSLREGWQNPVKEGSSRETLVLPEWGHLICAIGLAFAIVLAMLFYSHYLWWWDEEKVMAIFLALGAVCVLFFSCSWLSLFLLMLRTGFILRMNTVGIQYAGFAMIPWRSIQSVRTRKIVANDTEQIVLSIFMKEDAYWNERHHFWIRFSNSPLVSYHDSGREIRIPTKLLKKNAYSLDHAAKRWQNKAVI
ncbi:MAG: hypothetical protein ACKO1L_09350 [Brachymonas sp.]